MSKVDPIPFPFPVHEAERFWSKVIKGECWIFQNDKAGHHPFGYGWFYTACTVREASDRRRHRAIYAHRLAWVLTHGPIPSGLKVCHNCPGGDNPACVNPAHLFLGTAGDNFRDCLKKGRRSHCHGGVGVRNGLAKLDDDKVRQIRVDLAAGVRRVVLAQQHNVSKPLIDAIAQGRIWQHVV